MTSRRRAIGLGLLLAAAYVVATFEVGHRNLIDRRPLLDGLTPPPPYNWVSPPPSAAPTNKKPASGRFSMPLDPQAGIQANVFTTNDQQASVAMGQGAIPPLAGDTSVILTITPLAPNGLGAPPGGWQIAGNVYHIQATYRPSGTPVRSLHEAAQLVMAYPGTPGRHFTHVVLSSTDGKSWTVIHGIDSSAQQLVQVNTTDLGYFAVGRSTVGTVQKRSLLSRIGSILVIVIGLAVLAVLFVIGELRYRRRRRSRARAHGSTRPRPPKRRPRQRRRKLDPWE